MTLDRLDDEECNCAPSPRERRMLWPSLDRRGALTLGALGAVSLGVLGATGGPLLAPAFAAGYPSWADVERAKANEASKAAEITRIQGMIQSLAAEVQRTQAEVVARSNEYYEAQQASLQA
ncbi:M23 family peptidase, partial [Microbacterium lushaniae]